MKGTFVSVGCLVIRALRVFPKTINKTTTRSAVKRIPSIVPVISATAVFVLLEHFK